MRKSVLICITCFMILCCVILNAEDIQKINVDDISIAYRVYGSGEPLLLIMGYGSTMDTWPPELITKLANNYKVIVFDNRGMGGSTAGNKQFTLSQFAEDSANLLNGLKIDKANVLGWSMGSYIAQEMAISFPDKIDKLVLYGSTIGGKLEVPADSTTIAILNDYSGTPQQIGERFFKLLFPAGFLEHNPEFYKTFPIPKEHSSPESMGKQSQAIGLWKGTEGRINNIKLETLILCGTLDVIVPPQNSLILTKEINNSWLVRVDGAGHGLMYQYTDKTVEILKAFLH